MSATVTMLKPTEPAALVDTALIAKAATHLAARADALAKAEAAHARERAELESALETSELAIAGEGGDPLVAAIAVEEQSRRERVAHRVLERAADEQRKAIENHRLAEALALRPAHRAWRLKRLEAARAGDAADAAKRQAMADYAKATAEMVKLTHAGLPDVRDALVGPIVYRNAKDEVQHWKDRGISGDDLHPWDPGEAA